ncbi:hypothetical protein BgiBS90_009291, partial [Biomphalaria glabrata]
RAAMGSSLAPLLRPGMGSWGGGEAKETLFVLLIPYVPHTVSESFRCQNY